MHLKDIKIKWRHLHPYIKVILIVLIPFAIYLGTMQHMLYDEEGYREQFEKVGTYDRVPEADNVMDNLLNFFRGKEKIKSNFTIEETSHLYDVKRLIDKFTGFFYLIVFIKLALFAVIVFTSKKAIDDVIHITMGSGLLTFIYPMMLTNINFNFLFSEFHELFFPQGNWEFAESSLLIQLFPEEFFRNFLSSAMTNAMFLGGCLISFSVILWFVTRKE